MIEIFAQAVTPVTTNGWDALVTIMPGILACIAATVAAYFSYLNGQRTNAVAFKTQSIVDAVKVISVNVDGKIARLLDTVSKEGVLRGAADATEKERALAAELLKMSVLPAITHEDVAAAVAKAVANAVAVSSEIAAKATAQAIAKLQKENLASIADRAAIHQGMVNEAARDLKTEQPGTPATGDQATITVTGPVSPAPTPLEQRVGPDPFSPCGKKAP